LHRGGIADQLSINFAGAGFELAILLGGIFVGEIGYPILYSLYFC